MRSTSQERGKKFGVKWTNFDKDEKTENQSKHLRRKKEETEIVPGMKSNRTTKSERMLKKCISIEPSFTPAYLELARLRGPNDMGVGNLLKQVMKLNDGDPYYGTLYAHWLLNKGNSISASKVYWTVLRTSSSYQEAMLKISKILRKTGQKSRLFQTLTRWQAILRRQRGEVPLSAHVYLQGWHLKKELNSKARVYDECQPVLFVSTSKI
ncbi:hypothetical protein HHI36_011990 [Cryptolaemus montrouzieri]|uniref:Uncharacterized protein n=1 Tax=Cryptolaemus montrouzieri TaxID=559131 RepID=A0ABD2NCY2_9CUCU